MPAVILSLASVASIGMLASIILNCTDTSKYGKKCQRMEFFLCRLAFMKYFVVVQQAHL